MACKCDVGLSNTGTECTPLMAVARQYVIVPKFKADGTLNKIDLTATHNGIIVTKDGFKATTIRPIEFTSLTSELPFNLKIEEIDNSSIFYQILVT